MAPINASRRRKPVPTPQTRVVRRNSVSRRALVLGGTAGALATAFGALELLKETLNEEEQTDKRLSQIASHVNLEAAEAAPKAGKAAQGKTRTAQ